MATKSATPHRQSWPVAVVAASPEDGAIGLRRGEAATTEVVEPGLMHDSLLGLAPCRTRLWPGGLRDAIARPPSDQLAAMTRPDQTGTQAGVGSEGLRPRRGCEAAFGPQRAQPSACGLAPVAVVAASPEGRAIGLRMRRSRHHSWCWSQPSTAICYGAGSEPFQVFFARILTVPLSETTWAAVIP